GRARADGNPILPRCRPSPRKNTVPSLTTRRSAGTRPKYASFTTGPSADSGPGVIGSAIVVCADGANIPRIHTDTRPDCGCQDAFPLLVTVRSEEHTSELQSP